MMDWHDGQNKAVGEACRNSHFNEGILLDVTKSATESAITGTAVLFDFGFLADHLRHITSTGLHGAANTDTYLHSGSGSVRNQRGRQYGLHPNAPCACS